MLVVLWCSVLHVSFDMYSQADMHKALKLLTGEKKTLQAPRPRVDDDGDDPLGKKKASE